MAIKIKNILKIENNLPWVEKYRPKTLNDIIDHKEKIKILRTLISRHELPHLLLYGPPGTGKTSLILAISNELYGKNTNKYILELNASNDRGIDVIRGAIQVFAKTVSDKIKIIFLDEVDAMTYDAQNALKRVIEDNVERCRFCLVCNNINKIDEGLQSRCTIMSFSYLKHSEIFRKLKEIVEQEKINITDNAINILIKYLIDLRQILNKLQCIHNLQINIHNTIDYPIITETIIYEQISRGSENDIKNLIEFLRSSTILFKNKCDYMFEILYNNVWNISDLITDIINYIIKYLVEREDSLKMLYIIKSLADLHFKINTEHDIRIALTEIVIIFCYHPIIIT